MAGTGSPKQLLFREVNERIRELSTTFAVAGESLHIMCECAEIDCVEPVEVPGDLYEEIRVGPGRFVVAPGHEPPEQHAASGNGAYRVVAPEPRAP
jgi:hypothetical protein